jgi:hypothetical protein
MDIRVATSRLGLCIASVALLCGFGEASLMQATSRLGGSPDYALVTFVMVSGGSASVDPLRGSTEIWDGDSLVGLVGPHQALQYKAAPGNHVFVLYNRTLGGINAQLLAGKSYYVNIKRGLFIGVSMEAIRPTDSRINPWPASFEFVALDAAAWDAQRQKVGCNFRFTRKQSPNACRAVERQRAEDIQVVRDGACAVHPFDSLQTTCKYLTLGPEDGG